MRVTPWFLICLAAQAYGYVGQWHSYTDKDRIACLQPYGDRLFVGTTGGIRVIDPSTLEEKQYGNLDGLLEANIVAMAVTPANQLWAASRQGFLYELDGARWQAYGRSYVSEQWRPNVRAAVAAGKYIALGTQKGLTFFDTDVKQARVNLTKFVGQSDLSVLSLLRKGDTLFIGTGTGAFKAAVDWNDILSSKYQSIFNPNIWIPVEFPPQVVPPDTSSDSALTTVPADTGIRQFDHLVFKGDTLESFPRGTVQFAPIEVEALLGKPLRISGKTYPTISGFDAVAQIGNRIFLGSPRILGVILDAKSSTPAKPNLLGMPGPKAPPETLLNVVSSGGNTFAMSQSALYRLENETWTRVPGYAGDFPEIQLRNLRTLSLGQDGSVYIGSWGSGLIHVKDGQQTVWNSGNSPCMDTVLLNFTVVDAISQAHDGGLWATIFKKDAANSYDLIYLDLNRGKVTCPNVGGVGKAAHKVKVFSDTVVAVASEGGTDLYAYNKAGGGLQVQPWKSIRLDAFSESWDMEMDPFGRVWTLMAGKLVYAESLETSGSAPTAKVFDNFAGIDCHQMELDASGSFWIGCSNGLFHFSPASNADASQSERFSLDDGLLSNTISDVSVDKQNGRIWVATDLGISMYESATRPAAPDADHIKVYPNPFLAKHRFVLFDNLPRGAGVRIHTQSGSVIRFFPASSIKGGQCQWDGLNASGNKVTPGVYLYSIDGDGKTRQGKIIVAR